VWKDCSGKTALSIKDGLIKVLWPRERDLNILCGLSVQKDSQITLDIGRGETHSQNKGGDGQRNSVVTIHHQGNDLS
jgi:hypothetical protein